MTRMGRPIKDNAKRASVTIRMSDETNKKLKEYAATHNLSMTEVWKSICPKRSKCCEPPFQYY